MGVGGRQLNIYPVVTLRPVETQDAVRPRLRIFLSAFMLMVYLLHLNFTG